MKKVYQIVFVIYLFFVLWYTLLGREESYSVNMLAHPFWEYVNFFKHPDWHSAHDIVLNIVLFMPFGTLLPLFANKDFKSIAVFALLLSIFIELGQLIFNRGWCEIDDMFNNTVGACVGFFVYKLVYMITEKRMK